MESASRALRNLSNKEILDANHTEAPDEMDVLDPLVNYRERYDKRKIEEDDEEGEDSDIDFDSNNNGGVQSMMIGLKPGESSFTVEEVKKRNKKRQVQRSNMKPWDPDDKYDMYEAQKSEKWFDEETERRKILEKNKDYQFMVLVAGASNRKVETLYNQEDIDALVRRERFLIRQQDIKLSELRTTPKKLSAERDKLVARINKNMESEREYTRRRRQLVDSYVTLRDKGMRQFAANVFLFIDTNNAAEFIRLYAAGKEGDWRPLLLSAARLINRMSTETVISHKDIATVMSTTLGDPDIPGSGNREELLSLAYESMAVSALKFWRKKRDIELEDWENVTDPEHLEGLQNVLDQDSFVVGKEDVQKVAIETFGGIAILVAQSIKQLVDRQLLVKKPPREGEKPLEAIMLEIEGNPDAAPPVQDIYKLYVSYGGLNIELFPYVEIEDFYADPMKKHQSDKGLKSEPSFLPIEPGDNEPLLRTLRRAFLFYTQRMREVGSEEKELRDTLAALEERLKNVREGTIVLQDVEYPYKHSAEWLGRAEHSGEVRLADIVVHAIDQAFKKLIQYAKWDSNIPFEFPQYDEVLRGDFAKLTALEMGRSAQRFPNQYYKDSQQNRILVEERDVINNFKRKFKLQRRYDASGKTVYYVEIVRSSRDRIY